MEHDNYLMPHLKTVGIFDYIIQINACFVCLRTNGNKEYVHYLRCIDLMECVLRWWPLILGALSHVFFPFFLYIETDLIMAQINHLLVFG